MVLPVCTLYVFLRESIPSISERNVFNLCLAAIMRKPVYTPFRWRWDRFNIVLRLNRTKLVKWVSLHVVRICVLLCNGYYTCTNSETKVSCILFSNSYVLVYHVFCLDNSSDNYIHLIIILQIILAINVI